MDLLCGSLCRPGGRTDNKLVKYTLCQTVISALGEMGRHGMVFNRGGKGPHFPLKSIKVDSTLRKVQGSKDGARGHVMQLPQSAR